MDGQSSALYKFCDNVHDTNYRKLANTLKIILSCDEHDNSDADSDVGNSITTDCDNCAKLQNDRDRCIRLQTDSILKAADQENTIQSLQLQNKMYFDNLQTLTDDHNTLKATHLLCGTSGTGTVVCPGPAVDNLLVTQLRAELANCNRDLKTAKESETRTGTSVTKMGDQIKVMQQKNTELEQQLNAKTNDGHKVANTGIRNNCESEHWAARAHDCETIQEALRVENARLNAELTRLSAELVQTTNSFAHLTANAVNNSPSGTSVETSIEVPDAATSTSAINALIRQLQQANDKAEKDAQDAQRDEQRKLDEQKNTHDTELKRITEISNNKEVALQSILGQALNYRDKTIEDIYKMYFDAWALGKQWEDRSNHHKDQNSKLQNHIDSLNKQYSNSLANIRKQNNIAQYFKKLLQRITEIFNEYITTTENKQKRIREHVHTLNDVYLQKLGDDRRDLNTVIISRTQGDISYKDYLEDLLQSVQTIMFDIGITVMPYFQNNDQFRSIWDTMIKLHASIPDIPTSINVKDLASGLHNLLNIPDLKPDAVETMQQFVEQIQQAINKVDPS